MEKDSHVAYSYVVEKKSSSLEAKQCSSIPSHVKSQIENKVISDHIFISNRVYDFNSYLYRNV